jgi:hypothetical protein
LFGALLRTSVGSHFLSGADFDDGLVAYYSFEESGQQFGDAGENGLDGNLQTAKRERRGKFGKGLLFSNKNAKAQVPRPHA